MNIVEKLVGEYVPSVKDLEPFTFFEWNKKIYVKLRNRNKNIVDVWNIKENKPDWLMPNTDVTTVIAQITDGEIYGCYKTFGEVSGGQIFHTNGSKFFKAWPAGVDPEEPGPVGVESEEPGSLNAYDMNSYEFVHFDADADVVEKVLNCTIIRPAE